MSDDVLDAFIQHPMFIDLCEAMGTPWGQNRHGTCSLTSNLCQSRQMSEQLEYSVKGKYRVLWQCRRGDTDLGSRDGWTGRTHTEGRILYDSM